MNYWGLPQEGCRHLNLPKIAGILGTAEIRLEYTVLGDTVNLASRLFDLAQSMKKNVYCYPLHLMLFLANQPIVIFLRNTTSGVTYGQFWFPFFACSGNFTACRFVSKQKSPHTYERFFAHIL
ncbi:MAG: hypothetical protein WA705_25465 [Candidatus Ozemobacteraceae bacterium]